ncbi:MFS transporter [Vibrio sp.]|nr:MFS transporter [Vibrio sp.]
MSTITHSIHSTKARQGFTPFVIAAFTFMVAMMGTTLPTPIYTIYESQLSISSPMVTVIFAVYAAGVIGALLLTGNWSDQIGRKPILLAGLAFAVLSDIIFMFAQGLPLILVGRVLSGISAGLFASTATAAIMDLVPKGHERIGVLTGTAVNMGGLGLGPILAGAIAVELPNPMVTPYLLHLVLVVIAVAGFLFIPETVKRSPSPSFLPQKPALPTQVRAVFLPASISALAGFMVTGFYSAVVPNFLSQYLGYKGDFLIGFVAGFLFLCSTLGQIFVEHLPEKRRMHIGCIVLGIGVAIITVSMVMESLTILMVGTAVAGVGHGFAFKAGVSAVGAAAPEESKAASIASYFIVCYGAISIPVIVLGGLTLLFSLKTVSIYFSVISAILCLLAFVILMYMEREKNL